MLARLIIVIALALLVVAPMSWRNCVKLLLYTVVVEGAVRKWLFPGSQEAVFFAKDVIALIAYAKFLNDPKVPRGAPPYNSTFRLLLACTAFFVLLQVCNPNLGSPLVGFIGAKNYVLYMPLVFLVGHLFESQRDLYRFLRGFSLIIPMMFLLGVAQYNSAPNSWINVYSEETTFTSLVADRPRITGTFSYISGFSIFLIYMASIVVPFLYLQQSWWSWLLSRTNIVLITALMLMTGSRSTIAFVVVFSFGYLFLNPGLLLPRNLVRALPSVVGMLAVMSIFFHDELENYLFRVSTSSDSVHARISEAIFEPVGFMPSAGIFGYGAGATYRGSERIRELFDLPAATPIAIPFENEPGRVMLELGPFGFCLWFAMRIMGIVLLWKLFYTLSLPLTRQLAVTAALFHGITLLSPIVFGTGSAVFYWFLLGFLYLLPRVEAAEMAKASLQESNASEA